jgi:hypothetical protein
VPAERPGFDCSKAHPAMGNYHHHQNPSAFNLDLVTISNICDLYPADGLYAIDSTVHSPLIGFAYDGFPIYGAYGYKNTDGTGGITRIKSSYTLRNITTRTTSPTGATVATGPVVNTTYSLGYFREDYQYNTTSAATPDYLDEHNGRFCVTPEYPNGIYCYFATVDTNWHSAYPYVVGPTFYGVKTAAKVTSITETVNTYTPSATSVNDNSLNELQLSIYPNPASEFIAIQLNNLSKQNVSVELYDMLGKQIQSTMIYQGSTIAYFDTRTLYNGQYLIKLVAQENVITKTVSIIK